jgi:hypothetical protein
MAEEKPSLKERAVSGAGKFVSRKLGIAVGSGGLLVQLTSMGLDTNIAGWGIIAIAIIFIIVQGVVDVKERLAEGMGQKAAILAELKETMGELLPKSLSGSGSTSPASPTA